MYLESYSDKSFVLRGDSKKIREELSKLGKWNKNLRGGAGWIFSNTKRKQVEKIIIGGTVEEEKIANDFEIPMEVVAEFVLPHLPFRDVIRLFRVGRTFAEMDNSETWKFLPPKRLQTRKLGTKKEISPTLRKKKFKNRNIVVNLFGNQRLTTM